MYFGEIFKCLPTTTPHRLVLCIIDPKPFNCAAIEWGKTHGACALEECRKHHYSRGNLDLVISNAVFAISEDYSFLGILPGYVCDPNVLKSYGLVEVKYPYKYRGYAPTEACLNANFFCELVTQSSDHQKFQLKRSHSYYQELIIFGELLLLLSGARSNGNHRESMVSFIVYTPKVIAIDRITFNELFWENELLPKLVDFLTTV